ncbi:hypothetical protein A4D02_35170 [Niastella koreensis]|uniref:Uncharacterized protein n=2 Tax=Niastella koreensis TaxID=354356 RepID=G8TPB8_NIAKG|nr:hypothetical protein [Niastella koreensis]AEV96724.1 hypothetical protein Niako_0326 [Niastella koreensis GR20-10]OQP44382.1 hypothetical protein A4D02_35170 [Niastella koreensis]
MRIIGIVIGLICIINNSFAQRDSSFITGIKGYVSSIDSLIRAKPGFIAESIAEGPINSQLTFERSGRIDSSSFSGGFDIYTDKNRKGDTLYRINYNDNLLLYRVETYYYRSNQLVCAILILEDWEHGARKTVYKREEYYQNQNGSIHQANKIITDVLDDKYRWRVDISLPEKGHEYLKQFLDKNF